MGNKLLRNKKVDLILSILIAIILWAYVLTEENPKITQKFENIPVQILNAETLTARDLTIVNANDLVVSFNVEGKRSDISKLKADDIAATVDVNGYGYGENNIEVKVELPNSLEAKDLTSTRVKIKIDALVSVEKPVSISATETVKGQEMYISKIDPEVVTVTGARSLVETVNHIEGSIKSSDISDTKVNRTKVALFAVDQAGQEVKNVTLSSNKAGVEAQMLKTKTVPLSVSVIGEVSGKYSVSNTDIPEKVVIKASEEVLDSITSLIAKDVDISDITATSRIPVEVELPEGAYLTKAYEKISVYIVIDNVAFKDVTIPISSIGIYGLGEGLSTHLEAGTVTVNVRGNEALVNAATDDDITLQMNLSGLGEGAHTVDITPTYTKAFKSVSVSPKQIQVTITSGAQ